MNTLKEKTSKKINKQNNGCTTYINVTRQFNSVSPWPCRPFLFRPEARAEPRHVACNCPLPLMLAPCCDGIVDLLPAPPHS
jgi:hypothetical protein